MCSQQSIHTFFHHRVLGDSRFRQIYSANHLSFLQHSDHEATSLETLLGSPLVVNGRNHQSLQYHLDRDSQVLVPERVGGLDSLLILFGFDDGQGGNFMVSRASSPPSMLYVDYEVVGYHTHFLDLAKPIYQDGFFNVAYADVLYGDVT